MLYCYNRGRTSCCYVDEECGGNWLAINDKMTQKAVDFMQRPQAFLDNLVKTAGYDSCHRTEEYDADQCHQDCLEQERSDFAQECREGGGLFKCCIRSDVWTLTLTLHSHFTTQARQTLLPPVPVLLLPVSLHQHTRHLLQGLLHQDS